jgi:2-dehydropantoate 2-reductase
MVLRAANNTIPGPHWQVLGAGSIGCLFASELHRAGHRVGLLLRDDDSVRQYRKKGGIVLADGTVLALPAVSSTAVGAPITHLLVTTKAHQALAALAALGPFLTDKTAIVLMTNGMGVYQRCVEKFTPTQLFCATTTEGAWQRRRFELVHAGSGFTRVGQMGSRVAPPWLEHWQTLRLSVRWSEDIEARLWHKLCINSAINALTAVHGCRNGELLSNPALGRELDLLCTEISQLCRARGMPEMARSIADDVKEVAAATAANRSSMAQDVAAGRETEIDFINGYLCQIARRAGVAVPFNARLLKQLTWTSQ